MKYRRPGREYRVAVWSVYAAVLVVIVLPAVVASFATGDWRVVGTAALVVVGALTYVLRWELRLGRELAEIPERVADQHVEEITAAQRWEMHVASVEGTELLECAEPGCDEWRPVQRPYCVRHTVANAR